MTFTLHALWSSSWWTLGTMLTPVSGVANTNGEITPQVLRLCASFGSCHENQHSNENRKYASDNDRFCWQNTSIPNTNPNLLPPPKKIKAHNLRICSWNVRSLNKLGAISQLETVLEVYKVDIIALQEMRWTGQGQTNLSSVISTIVAMHLGTYSGVALQWAVISETSSLDLLQLTNA